MVRGWRRTLADRIAWTPPTMAEVGAVARAGLAAAAAWQLAVAVTDEPAPVLAPLTALISVRVSVHTSIRSAIERSAAVVVGVLVALALGNALGLNAWTVGILTSGSLAVALLVFRLPRPAATQIPVSALVVMSALAAGEEGYARERVIETVLGAAVGVVVSVVLPASRVRDSRQTLRRLATVLGEELDAMGAGVAGQWSTTETGEWRHTARLTRQRLVEETTTAIADGRAAAAWNVRDRPYMAELGRYEDVLPRLERTAIGVWAIARGLEDHAQLAGGEPEAMPSMGALLASLADLVRVFAAAVLGEQPPGAIADGVNVVLERRAPCADAAHQEAQLGVQKLEWMTYTALLVQVDRIVADLRQPLP